MFTLPVESSKSQTVASLYFYVQNHCWPSPKWLPIEAIWVALSLKLPSSQGNKLWPFGWHLGEPIHSQLPAATRRDFSPAIFKASYLFLFFLAKASVSFFLAVLFLFFFCWQAPTFFARHLHRYCLGIIILDGWRLASRTSYVLSCRSMHAVILTRLGFCWGRLPLCCMRPCGEHSALHFLKASVC